MSTTERTAKMDEVHFQIRSLQKIRDHVDVIGGTNVTSPVDDIVLQPVIAPALKKSPTPTGDDLETALQIFTLEAVQSLKGEVVAITDDNLESDPTEKKPELLYSLSMKEQMILAQNNKAAKVKKREEVEAAALAKANENANANAAEEEYKKAEVEFETGVEVVQNIDKAEDSQKEAQASEQLEQLEDHQQQDNSFLGDSDLSIMSESTAGGTITEPNPSFLKTQKMLDFDDENETFKYKEQEEKKAEVENDVGGGG